jgi:ATP-binding cassette subfamily B protein
MLTWPVTSLGWVSSLVQRAVASQTRINEFLNIKPTINNTSIEPFNFEKNILFKNVSFTYNNKILPALNNVSFNIEKGKTTAILGNTGSGKTTITQLILRMIDVGNGEILIDNKNIKDINLNAFRNQIGYVPQDVFLFSDSIKNNIAFGKENINTITFDEIKEASKKASLTENIERMPLQFETIIGERGVTLSGGQKQRTAIARAFLKNPPILIFDDSLSALDTNTESEILNTIYNEKEGKTMIIISQRVSSAKHADNILFFDKGVLVENGNHNELILLNKKYAELYNNQLTNSEFEIEEVNE